MMLMWACWCLCAIFLASLWFFLCMPHLTSGAELSFRILLGALLACCMLSATAALLLMRKRKSDPEARILKSKAALWFCIALAAFLTLVFFLGLLP